MPPRGSLQGAWTRRERTAALPRPRKGPLTPREQVSGRGEAGLLSDWTQDAWTHNPLVPQFLHLQIINKALELQGFID